MNINMSHELTRSRQSSKDIGDWNANVLMEVGTQTGNKKKEANSSVLLTICDNATIGSITLNDETYYIEPVKTKNETKNTEKISHIIYSSRDVENRKFLIDNGLINSNDNEPDAGYQSRTSNSEIENVLPEYLMSLFSGILSQLK